MKQKKGTGFAKLIVLIIIISSVVFIGVKYIKKEIKNKYIKNVQADLLLIQAKIEIVKGKYSVDKENNSLKGYQLTRFARRN